MSWISWYRKEISIMCIQYWLKEFNILFCSNTPTNLGQFSKPGLDLKSAGPDVFKTPPIPDHVLADIFEVKDTWYHSFIFLIIDFLEIKITLIWTICSKNCSVHHQRYQYQQELSLEIPSKGLWCLINWF